MSRNLTGCLDYFVDGKSNAVTEVENITVIALHKVINREDVRLRKVSNMNVISDTCSILGRIIIAENIDCFPLSERNLKDERNKMCLRLMCLTYLAAYMRTAGIKISE